MDNYINVLIEILRQSDPYKIIIFGSYANGTATGDSGIGIMVIRVNSG